MPFSKPWQRAARVAGRTECRVVRPSTVSEAEGEKVAKRSAECKVAKRTEIGGKIGEVGLKRRQSLIVLRLGAVMDHTERQ